MASGKTGFVGVQTIPKLGKVLYSTKVWIKSYGSALVRIRWKFSDEALWIRGLPTNR
jgi:hypothetical protein